MIPYAITSNDIAVGVFTSALNLRERALSVQNTWLKDFKNGYLIGGWYSDPKLRMVSLGAEVGEDYQSAHKKQFLGLLELHKRFPEAKWYFITGCDAFVCEKNLTALLGTFDYHTPLLIGGHCGRANIGDADLLYPSGGPGFALSRSLVDALAGSIPGFIAEWEARRDGLSGACDVAMAFLVKIKVSAGFSYSKGFYNNPPYDYPGNGFLDGSGKLVHEDIVSDPIAFHGLSIREMYELADGYLPVRPGIFLRFMDLLLRKTARYLKTKRLANSISRLIAKRRRIKRRRL